MMYGRYGSDQLNLFLMGAWVAAYLVSLILSGLHLAMAAKVFSILAYLCIVLSLFRMLSRSYDKRRRENDWFMERTGPLTHGIRQKRAQLRDRDHKYFRCTSCGQVLRVPKGKGKINIRCRNCGNSFQKKT